MGYIRYHLYSSCTKVGEDGFSWKPTLYKIFSFPSDSEVFKPFTTILVCQTPLIFISYWHEYIYMMLWVLQWVFPTTCFVWNILIPDWFQFIQILYYHCIISDTTSICLILKWVYLHVCYKWCGCVFPKTHLKQNNLSPRWFRCLHTLHLCFTMLDTTGIHLILKWVHLHGLINGAHGFSKNPLCMEYSHFSGIWKCSNTWLPFYQSGMHLDHDKWIDMFIFTSNSTNLYSACHVVVRTCMP